MALPAALALSGLNESQFDGLTDVFNHGALLLKSPKSANKLISKEKTTLSLPDLTPANARNFFDLLVNALQSKQIEEQPVDKESDFTTAAPNQDVVVVAEEKEKDEKDKDKIFYGHRDLLDLATNMRSGWNFPMAKIQAGTQYFFENRSQYTRVLGSNMPKHVMIKCPFKDCTFEAPQYDE